MVEIEIEDITEQMKIHKKTDFVKSGKDRLGRDLYKGLCSRCGKVAEVPFLPNLERPVYCRECLKLRQDKPSSFYPHD